MLLLPGFEIHEQKPPLKGMAQFFGRRLDPQAEVEILFFPIDMLLVDNVETLLSSYRRLSQVISQHVARLVGAEKITHEGRVGIAAALEMASGVPLIDIIEAPGLSVDRFLDMAIQLVTAVNDLHRGGIIYRGFTSHGIRLNPENGLVRVTWPAPPAFLLRQQALFDDRDMRVSGIPAPFLPYMSPEQTGRMNRRPDFRTDFYSLGVIFYEMLTGAPPFGSTDAKSVIHGHMTLIPAPPVKIRPEIPQPVSDIVMKLLGKNPAERYQCAYGLRVDLKYCRERLKRFGHMDFTFTPGDQDAPEQLTLSTKFYGRDKALKTLSTEFERVCRGAMSFVMISGCPGSGKTRLVEEFKKIKTRSNLYFITGRFGELPENIPYSGIMSAFKDLVGQILTESTEKLTEWRSRFTEALGENAQIIIDAVPELQLIVGQQLRVAEVSPSETQNRFNLTFEKFFRAIGSKDRPLVLFIDDMQWMDHASRKQINAFFSKGRARHILFIGAYRDNNPEIVAPIISMIDNIKEKGGRIATISTDPVTEKNLFSFLDHTLKRTGADLDSLARVIYEKTGGIPSAIRELLVMVNRKNLLAFDFETGCWQWDIEKIQAISPDSGENAPHEFMIDHLPEQTQEALAAAAVAGKRFTPVLISPVIGKKINEIAINLWPAFDAGIITAGRDASRRFRDMLIRCLPPQPECSPIASGDMEDIVFEFANDTIRQSIYLKISEKKRKKLHALTGRSLLDETKSAGRSSRLFEIVNHLNLGTQLPPEAEHNVELAGLNLEAGGKAAGSRAYDQAVEYLSMGRKLLSDNGWEEDYDLMFHLFMKEMECEFLNMNFSRADDLFKELCERAAGNEDRALAYKLKMIMAAGMANHEEALENGLAALSLLGMRLPARAGKISVLKAIMGAGARLLNRDIDGLLDIPAIDDRRIVLAVDILANLCFSAFLCSPYLAIVASLKVLSYTLKFGNSEASAFGYMVYGASLCAIFKNFSAGSRFAKLAFSVNEKFGSPPMLPKLLLLYGSGISVWNKHIKKGIDCHRQGVKTALAGGDINYAGYHIQSVLIFLVISGAPLKTVLSEYERYGKFVENTGDTGAINYLVSVRQFAKALLGKTAGAALMDDEDFDETRHIRGMNENGIPMILLRHYLLKLRLLYIMGIIDGAVDMGAACEKLLYYHIGTIIEPEFYFFHALTLAAAHEHVSRTKRAIYPTLIRRYEKKLKKLAQSCPENYLHKHLLVSAERMRITGKAWHALPLYHRSAKAAKEAGFIQNQAIAYERAAECYESLGLDDLAGPCITAARDAYRKWDAEAKAAALEAKYPLIPSGRLPDKALAAFDSLDFSAIVDALLMISTEIVIPDLLKNLMKIVAENAGATKTEFLTIKEDRIYLEARLDADRAGTSIFPSIPADGQTELFMPVINYVRRTGRYMVSDDAATESDFASCPYFFKYRPKSVLCLPVTRQSSLVAILYLENNIAPAVFTPARIEVIQLLAAQAAISFDNARLYENVIHNEKELREVSQRREEEFLRYQAKLRSLSSELSLTEERERRRIARQLHDRIGHALTNASMKMRLIINQAGKSENIGHGESVDRLRDINAFIEQSIKDTQTLTFELSPPILYDLGLEAALDWLAEQTEKQHGLRVACIDDMEHKPIDESLRVLLFQAARELLFNIVKHARATEVKIFISREDENVRVAIEDNGVGFDATRAEPKDIKKGGFGLFSIRERLALAGGRLEIKSEQKKGSRVTMISPMKDVGKDAV
ncbi:MAG: AAA family ATPase [Deltaproteobacteria bacterium]|nr:AAA family ATPase [Deltaproteobacteria bacterium]